MALIPQTQTGAWQTRSKIFLQRNILELSERKEGEKGGKTELSLFSDAAEEEKSFHRHKTLDCEGVKTTQNR